MKKQLLLCFILSSWTCSGPNSSIFVAACGPGRGAIRRRGGAFKLTPLVYKQHEPNFSERSLAASGLPEGVVHRTSDKFRHLVPNYNPDILFKDEEGTGADRLMTQRCREKLNTLAISVMNQWPGVRLRVTEAWDEDFHHAQQSLHYEGRAIDITTSDRDRSKYGLLARLAVESGFDWVYYESRAHIHTSCKSEATHPSESGGCFKGDSLVMTEDGKQKRLSQVAVGDRLLSLGSQGQLQFSPVLLFLDRDSEQVRQFQVLQMENGASLTVTPFHLVYAFTKAADSESDPDMVDFVPLYAESLREGDLVLVQQRGGLQASRIVQISSQVHKGVFAPLTAAGNIVVDGTLASCYALVQDASWAHTAFAPFRWWHSLQSVLRIAHTDSNAIADSGPSSQVGMHWYASILYKMTGSVLLNDLPR